MGCLTNKEIPMYKHTITISITEDSQTCKLAEFLKPFINGLELSVYTRPLKLKPLKLKEPKPTKVKPPKVNNLFNNDMCEWITNDCIKDLKLTDKTVTYGLAINETNQTLPGLPILLFTRPLDLPLPFAEKVKQHFQNKYENAVWILVNKIPPKSMFSPNNKERLKKWKETEVQLLSHNKTEQKIFTDLCSELWSI